MGEKQHRSLPSLWHPWRHAARHYPHVGIRCDVHLGMDRMGVWTEHGIYLDAGLDRYERRCTLGHELVHLERGPVPDDPEEAAEEERIVDDLATRRLLPLVDVTEALLVHHHCHRRLHADPEDAYGVDVRWLGMFLQVDAPTLLTRLRNLTAEELAYIRRAFEVP